MAFIFIPKTCQWIGQHDDRCNATVTRGMSYCDEHYRRCYTKGDNDSSNYLPEYLPEYLLEYLELKNDSDY